MARLPLEVRGELDHDPIRRAARSELPTLLAGVLAADTGLSLRERVTNRMLVERIGPQPRSMPGVALAAGSARIGAFAFERTAAGWRLHRIYVPND